MGIFALRVNTGVTLMPRTRRNDGTPAASPNKRNLTERFLERVQPDDRAFLVWDTYQHGLALQVRPNGHKTWKVIYAHRGRPRWYPTKSLIPGKLCVSGAG